MPGFLLKGHTYLSKPESCKFVKVCVTFSWIPHVEGLKTIDMKFNKLFGQNRSLDCGSENVIVLKN